jgi:uncharacterized RDD family membrane protein YckC
MFKLAGFWERVLAYVLDLVLLVPFGFIILIVNGNKLELTAVYCMGLLWLYMAGLESTFWRGTIGKKLVGIQVTNLSGQTLSLGQSLLRNLVKLISISWIFTLFTARKQALHDLAAKSLVVKG